MLAILGIVSTGLSVVSSALNIAKIIKDWRKPAGYLIRFINFIGGIVDWLIAKIELVQSWFDGKKDKVDTKRTSIKVEKTLKRRRGRKHWSRWGKWREKL
jgi:hypothetical protein